MTILPTQISPTLYTAKPRGVGENSAYELNYQYALPNIPDTRDVPEGSRTEHKRRRAKMINHTIQAHNTALARAEILVPNKNVAVPLSQDEIYLAILESITFVNTKLIAQNYDLRDAARFVVRLFDAAKEEMSDKPIHMYAPGDRQWVKRLREIING